LRPLAGLTSLRVLRLNGWRRDACRFGPLLSVLPTLKEIYLFGCNFDDLPVEVCGESSIENVLANVRAHFEGRLSPPRNVTRETDVFVSYAWGDTSLRASKSDRTRQEIVERMCQTLEMERCQVVRDKTAMRYGDLISAFMDTIGQAHLVIVILSDKYLRSSYCMTELYAIYQRSLGEKEDFLRRIIPLVLDDARIRTWRDRVVYAKHWETEFKAMEKGNFRGLGQTDFRLYQQMQKWYVDLGDMLAYMNDVLHPYGFDDIVKDDFAVLRQMLQRTRSEPHS
jgi:hypothetical protein